MGKAESTKKEIGQSVEIKKDDFQGLLATIQQLQSEVSNLKKESGVQDLQEVKHTLFQIKETLKHLVREMENFGRKEEIRVLEKYINLWNPMNFVTAEELDRAIEEKLKSLDIIIPWKKEKKLGVPITMKKALKISRNTRIKSEREPELLHSSGAPEGRKLHSPFDSITTRRIVPPQGPGTSSWVKGIPHAPRTPSVDWLSNPPEKFVISVTPSAKAPIKAARWEIDLSGGSVVTSPLKTLMVQLVGLKKSSPQRSCSA